MKRKLSLVPVALLLFFASAFAQNLQLHYDFGKTKDGISEISRQCFTSTLEFFKPDDNGSTFVFVDMDYDTKNGGVQLLYWEISRDLRFWDFPLEAHVEFTGGNYVNGDNAFGGYIGRSWIFGVNYPFSAGKFTFSAAALYRSFRSAQSPDFQFTGTWFANFLNDKLTFTGFIDLWTTDKYILLEPDGKNLLLLTEPQLWFNINKTFSIGSELEISRKFVTMDDKLHFMPTAAIKWNF
jgi:hypothetical protein